MSPTEFITSLKELKLVYGHDFRWEHNPDGLNIYVTKPYRGPGGYMTASTYLVLFGNSRLDGRYKYDIVTEVITPSGKSIAPTGFKSYLRKVLDRYRQA